MRDPVEKHIHLLLCGKRPPSPDIPRDEPCALINPALWDYYCRLTDRPVYPAATWWTEADVVQSIDKAEIVALDDFYDYWGMEVPTDHL